MIQVDDTITAHFKVREIRVGRYPGSKERYTRLECYPLDVLGNPDLNYTVFLDLEQVQKDEVPA
jgi:hypothetical protein